MQDPSQGIQRELQPHVHLLSTYRFPQLQTIHPDKVAEWLLSAPRIARSEAPFYWTYLDRPADGTILLVWQSGSMGHDFPSDGYVWAPNETPFQVEVAGGFVLEMFHHKVGYGPGEPFATHARRRYRLHPSRNPNHTSPNPDLSLWIIHYSTADPNDRVPSNIIPVDMRAQQTMSVRQHLHAQGQIVQKDFMLHDRPNWPSIAFPRGRPQGQQPVYANNPPPARVTQQMAYPTQHTQPPPAKRARPNPSQGPAGAGNPAAALEIDDEEDTSRGDLFDHTTPREISIARYKQNHEWMEEILSSPYAISQIVPTDLGLGVRGDLAALTTGIFDAPFDPDKDVVKYEYVGRLDEGKAEEFRKRTNERIAKESKEIELLKARHARRLAKFKKGYQISVANRELRTAVNDPDSTGPEFWRLEGKIDEEDNENNKTNSTKKAARVSDIVAKVETSVGRHARAVQDLARIQDGGYEEAPVAPSPPPVQPPSAHVSPAPGSHHNESQNGNGSGSSGHSSNGNGLLGADGDLEMGNSAAGLLDQFHTGLSSTATPGSVNFPTPGAHIQSNVGTPNLGVNSPAATLPQGLSTGTPASSSNGFGPDGAGRVNTPPVYTSAYTPSVAAHHAEPAAAAQQQQHQLNAPSPGLAVPKPADTTATPQTQIPLPTTAIAAENNTVPPPSTSAIPSATNTPLPNSNLITSAPQSAAPSNANTPLPNLTSNNPTPAANADDFADLGDLDGGFSGDLGDLGGLGDHEGLSGGLDDGGLGGVAEGGNGLGDVDVDVHMHDGALDDTGLGGDLGGDLDGGMDDSAFGDAFHGVEPRSGEGEGDGEGADEGRTSGSGVGGAGL